MTKRRKPFAANLASRKMLEADGWTVAVVEQRIPHCFITRDAWGFVDMIALSPTRGILFVQATGGGNLSSRASKVRENPIHAIALASGARIQIHDWVKRAGKSERECRVLEILPDSDRMNCEVTSKSQRRLTNGRNPTPPYDGVNSSNL